MAGDDRKVNGSPSNDAVPLVEEGALESLGRRGDSNTVAIKPAKFGHCRKSTRACEMDCEMFPERCENIAI